ncbi:hypothetical protein TKK_0001157 [Trichogramma kaykai]
MKPAKQVEEEEEEEDDEEEDDNDDGDDQEAGGSRRVAECLKLKEKSTIAGVRRGNNNGGTVAVARGIRGLCRSSCHLVTRAYICDI